MPLGTLNVDPETFFRVERSGRPLVVYECKLEGVPCGMFVEGTTSALSAHLRRHGITGPDSANTSCPWSRCQGALLRVQSGEMPPRSPSCAYQIVRVVWFRTYRYCTWTRRSSSCPYRLDHCTLGLRIYHLHTDTVVLVNTLLYI